MAAYPYSWPWPIVRLQVLERDRYRCRIKGPKCTGHATQVDHIVPWLEGGAAWDPANLRAACVICNEGRSSMRAANKRRLAQRDATSPASRDW